MMTYYQILLWEKWLHEIVKRLQEWITTINEYFGEFNGSWEYYALSKRLEFIETTDGCCMSTFAAAICMD